MDIRWFCNVGIPATDPGCHRGGQRRGLRRHGKTLSSPRRFEPVFTFQGKGGDLQLWDPIGFSTDIRNRPLQAVFRLPQFSLRILKAAETSYRSRLHGIVLGTFTLEVIDLAARIAHEAAGIRLHDGGNPDNHVMGWIAVDIPSNTGSHLTRQLKFEFIPENTRSIDG
jgi:hypothetical protein